MDSGHPGLVAWLRDRIRARGPIPFVEFMEAALYHPELGYYCREEATTGPDGDYYTSPDVHPAFGRLIARQVAEIAEAAAEPLDPFTIVEVGPGTGKLARDLIAGLAAERPDLARRVRYRLVEVSPSLRHAQQATLKTAGSAAAVADIAWARWQDLLEQRDAPRGERFTGCVVANELLDALPVHVVEQVGGVLREVHVEVVEDRFGEVMREPSTSRLASHLAALGITLGEGQRAEIGLRALDWVASLDRLFRVGDDPGRGGAILVDYGHTAQDLYDPVRQRGTLLCYSRHRTHEDPYALIGKQDMTAHVDFTSLTLRAREAGFDAAPIVTQLKFLVSLGLAKMLAELAAAPAGEVGALKDRLALHGLMAPGGMGEVFKVLLLGRGISASALVGARDPFRQD